MLLAKDINLILEYINAIKLELQRNAEENQSAEQSVIDLEQWVALIELEECLNNTAIEEVKSKICCKLPFIRAIELVV